MREQIGVPQDEKRKNAREQENLWPSGPKPCQPPERFRPDDEDEKQLTRNSILGFSQSLALCVQQYGRCHRRSKPAALMLLHGCDSACPGVDVIAEAAATFLLS